MKNSEGRLFGKVDYDIATYAMELENYPHSEKLKKTLKLELADCQDDPTAYIDVTVTYQNRDPNDEPSHHKSASSTPRELKISSE